MGGKILRQWLPSVVTDVVRHMALQRIVLFGSVARDHEGPDSDLGVDSRRSVIVENRGWRQVVQRKILTEQDRAETSGGSSRAGRIG